MPVFTRPKSAHKLYLEIQIIIIYANYLFEGKLLDQRVATGPEVLGQKEEFSKTFSPILYVLSGLICELMMWFDNKNRMFK